MGEHHAPVTVSEVTPDDEPNLRAFHERLPAEDAVHEYCSLFRASRAGGRRGPGRRLIARDGNGAIVADGGYERLDDDDAALDLVVTPEAPPGLGDHLLDRLVDLAAAEGIRNLRAEVHVDNGAALALLLGHPHVNAGHDDHTVAHVVLAAAAATPRWTRRHERPRILIEGGGLGWIPDGLGRALDVEVLQCPGPRHGPCSRCPMVEGGACPLVAGADAVVCAIGDDDGRSRLLAAHQRRNRGTRVFVTTPVDTPSVNDVDVELLPDDRPVLEAVVRALGQGALSRTSG